VELRVPDGLLEQLAWVAVAGQHVDSRVQDDSDAGLGRRPTDAPQPFGVLARVDEAAAAVVVGVLEVAADSPASRSRSTRSLGESL
jgi:hypothetical protein